MVFSIKQECKFKLELKEFGNFIKFEFKLKNQKSINLTKLKIETNSTAWLQQLKLFNFFKYILIYRQKSLKCKFLYTGQFLL